MTEKLYIENPYLKEITAKITRKYKQNHKYFNIMDKTIFYPHLVGGQTRDLGKINDIDVVDVFLNSEDEIVHVTNHEIPQNKVLLKIDWENRFDNMQQHTGQHILSSSFKRFLNADTIGFSLGKNFSYITINKSSLSLEEAAKVELLANRIIQSNFKVKSFKSLDKNSKKFNYTVEVDGIHTCDCCGTHVKNTGEVGLVKIVKWEGFKGNIKIEFLSGQRAIKNNIWKNQYINSLSHMLSSKDRNLIESLQSYMDKSNEKDLEIKRLRRELLAFKSDLLLKDLKEEESIKYILHSFKSSNLKEVESLTKYICKNHNDIVQIYTVDNKDSGLFLISKGDYLNINLKEVLKNVSEQIIIKAGSSENMIQGSSNVNLLDKIGPLFLKEIKKQL